LQPEPQIPFLAPAAGEGALGPYFRAVRAHRLVFVAVVLAALLGSVAWLAVRTPQYEASSQLLLNPLPQDDTAFLGFDLLRDSGDPTRTAQTAASLVETRSAAERTAVALGDDWTATKVEKAVDVEPEGESNIVAVTATADSAALAARIANQFANSAIAERKAALTRQIDAEVARLEAGEPSTPDATAPDNARRIAQLEALKQRGDPTLTASQAAVPPESSTSASLVLVIALALIAGLALGVGAAVLLEITGRRVRDEEEAVSLFPLPVLARVPDLARRFRRERRPGEPWIMAPSVREAFRTLFVQLERDEASRVIMFTSASTGDGKTTSAVNLAASIAAAGHRTILMDLDLRKPDVARMLNVDHDLPLLSLLGPAASLYDLLLDVQGVPNLSLLATGTMTGHDYGVLEVLGARLPDLIDQARQDADFVVIDTAPLGEVSDALRFSSQADEIVVVTRPGSTNRTNFTVMRDLLGGANEQPRGYLMIGETGGGTNRYHTYGAGRGRNRLFAQAG
jgi:capsular exopolysaccharide synthesis family protein